MKNASNQAVKNNKQSIAAYGWDEAWGLLSMLLAYLAICAAIMMALSLFTTPVQAGDARAEIIRMGDIRQGGAEQVRRYPSVPNLNADIAIYARGE